MVRPAGADKIPADFVEDADDNRPIAPAHAVKGGPTTWPIPKWSHYVTK